MPKFHVAPCILPCYTKPALPVVITKAKINERNGALEVQISNASGKDKDAIRMIYVRCTMNGGKVTDIEVDPSVKPSYSFKKHVATAKAFAEDWTYKACMASRVIKVIMPSDFGLEEIAEAAIQIFALPEAAPKSYLDTSAGNGAWEKVEPIMPQEDAAPVEQEQEQEQEIVRVYQDGLVRSWLPGVPVMQQKARNGIGLLPGFVSAPRWCNR